MSTNYFLGYWCNEGFESVTDITEHYHNQLLNALKGTDDKELGHMLFAMRMRAQFNSHRNYELYALSTEESITIDYLRELADQSPQTCADLFRKHGHKLFANTSSASRTVIV